jgi:hypothetical protein
MQSVFPRVGTKIDPLPARADLKAVRVKFNELIAAATS